MVACKAGEGVKRIMCFVESLEKRDSADRYWKARAGIEPLGTAMIESVVFVTKVRGVLQKKNKTEKCLCVREPTLEFWFRMVEENTYTVRHTNGP